MARLVHQSRVQYPVSQPREELLRVLRETDEVRRDLTREVNLEEIWELAAEEGDSVFSPVFLAGLCFGEEATDNHVAAFLRCVFEDRLFFKYKEGKVLAHTPEVVEQLRARREKERQREVLLENGARGLRDIWEGREVRDWPEKEHCLQLLAEFYLKGNDAPESALARELLKRARFSGPHDVFFLLVRAGVWEEDENIGLLRYEIPQVFSDQVLKQAAVAPPDYETLRAEGRRDLTGLPLLTIDGEGTRDFDDALHVERRGENYLVGIHITDVARYVAPGDLLFEEAMRRVTSIYFPDAIVPMLPRSLSEGTCSLIAGKVRAAMSFLVLLDEGGRILDSEIVPSIVKVERQLSYVEAEGMAATDQELADLVMLSRNLRRRRIEAGALLLPIPDVNISIAADKTVSVEVMDVDTRTRTLVAEFMVLANTLAAQFVADRQVPGLFRAQEPPHQRLIQGVDKDLFINFRQRKQLKPGQLLITPRQHSGVGAMCYTTITSPIRRFLDLVMQHQLYGLIKGQGACFADRELNDLIAVITTTQGRVNQVRRLRHRYWLLKYLEPLVGESVEALIVEKGPRRVGVVLLDCLLDGELPPSQGVKARAGEVVQVTISRVSPLDNILRLAW